MITKLDERDNLLQILNRLDDKSIQKLNIFALGLEAGRLIHKHPPEEPQKPPENQTA